MLSAASTHNSVPTNWTDERKNLLDKIFMDGSLAWIAKEINRRTGSSFTRGAVAGAAYRFGVAAKFQKRAMSKRRGRPRLERPVLYRETPRNRVNGRLPPDHAALDRYEELPPPAHFIGVTFADLKQKHCRFIVGAGLSGLYCGQPRIEDSSYCADCHRICWYRK
jgi:hypothetical protein